MEVEILVYNRGDNGYKRGEHGVRAGLETQGQGCVSGGPGGESRDRSRELSDQGLPMQPTDRHHQHHQSGGQPDAATGAGLATAGKC